MSVRGIGRLRRVIRSISNRFVPSAIIFLYHRIADLPSDPQLLAVSPGHFAEHLEILKRNTRPMRLQGLQDTLADRKNRGCGAVVTFDDGYADNLYNAKPLLDQHDVPATVFVTTGYVGARREFWQDELEKIFLQPRQLPEKLRLNISGKAYEWNLGRAADYDQNARHRDWNVSHADNPTPRHELYRRLIEILQPLPNGTPQEILTHLLAWAGLETTSRPTHRTLSLEEVARLAESGLVEVGAHTANHPVLASLTMASQQAEISASKARLEAILGRRVTSFAYPYGQRSDFTVETVAAVRQAGFECACANFPGTVRSNSDLWQLPRFLVRDWNGEQFAGRLREWLSE